MVTFTCILLRILNFEYLLVVVVNCTQFTTTTRRYSNKKFEYGAYEH